MKKKALVPSLAVNEKGFVLVTALLFLVILSIIGIMASNTSVMEVQIAGNDRVHKQTFSQADGGTEIGSNLLEENISCPAGFTGPAPLRIGAAEITENIPTGVTGARLNFWANEKDPSAFTTPVPYPSDSQRHVRIPNNNNVPHTNLHFFGSSSLATGSAIQMISGYEGTGYGAATGGGQLVVNVDSQHVGESNNSMSAVRCVWRHVIGHEGVCKY